MRFQKLLPIIAMLSIVFMESCKKDAEVTINPTVISTSPVNNATTMGVSSAISATFSVAMDPATMTTSKFTVQKGTTNVPGSVAFADKTATFTPNANLEFNTVYTATIITGVKNLTGQSLAANYVWSFTTNANPDTTAPTVTLANPLNNATGVLTGTALVITFSEAMDQSTITSSAFTVKQGTTVIAGAVTHTSTTATFTPTSVLLFSKIYTATISTGVKDVAGNALATAYVYSFTTIDAPDTTPPTVVSTDPSNNLTNVARNKVITVVFSEAMTLSTIGSSTFTVKQGTSAVAGAVAYSGTTATFTPSISLSASMVYTATITTGAKDLAGNALATNSVWTFTTGALSTLAPVDLGAAGNYVILAKTAITNISTSAVTGDLGLSPAAESYITGLSLTDATGYATSAQVTGKVYAADQASPTPVNLTTAVNNMITAYTDAAGRPTPDFSELGTGNIGGHTLTSGLYKWSTSVTIPSDVTISGGANEVWIFQISGNLNMSAAVNVTLSGGAQAKNIFWQVAGQATFGTTSHFEGIVMSQTGITLQTGATMTGRALAQTAVILDGNALTKP